MGKVERAVIMAAGSGTRLNPVTMQTPKPLVRVDGVPMIETIINALNQNGINEIYIVIGYLKEQFTALAQKYPGIRLLENPYYDMANNISSLFAARKYIRNAFIIDGDQVVRHPEIFHTQFEQSGYFAAWTAATKEWLLEVEENRIKKCSRTGGKHGYQLYGVSIWDEKEGEKLSRYVEQEFVQNKNHSIYWDDIPLFVYPGQFNLGIRRIGHGDIIEIDSLDELREVDPTYYKQDGGAYVGL